MLDLERPTTPSAKPEPTPAPARRPGPRTVAVEPADVGYRIRLAAAAVTAISVLLVALGAIVGAHGVQAFGASAFFLGTVGSAGASQVRRISLATYLLFSVAGSLTVTLLTGFVLAETHLWHPTAAFLVLACVGLGLHASALRKHRRTGALDALTRTELLRRARTAALPLAALVVGFALLVGTCVAHAGAHVGYVGQFGRLGVPWALGLALIVLAVPLCIRVGAQWLVGLAVTALATALALTPALLYEYPTVTSAARHVGVVQTIRHVGGVVRDGGIYHAWPGLFAGSGMIWDVGDVTNPLAWARWFPVLINPVSAIAVYVLARRFMLTTTGVVGDVRLWLAGAVFAVTNILGNAYFSPQSTCFVLAMAVLVLAVPTEQSLTGRGKLLRLTGLTVTAFAITITHQLTPYLVVLALFVLMLFKLVRPWKLLALVGAPAVAWALINYNVLAQYINLGAIGNATANAKPPDHGGHLGYRELTKVAIYTPLLLFVVVGIAALVAAIRMRNRFGWALLACAASPALLFFGNAYGNEAIFRVSLFSLPWLCLLVAARPVRHRIRPIAVAAGLLVAAAVFAVGTYGMDWYRVIRPGTVAAVAKFEQTAPAGSAILIPGSGNALPGRLTDRSGTMLYLDRELLRAEPAIRGYRPTRDVARLAHTLADRLGGKPAIYAIVNTATGAYDDLYGIQKYSDFQRMSVAFAHSRYWKPVFSAPSATLYRLDVQAAQGAR
ncbi:MAG TPA: hypothetical protein VGH43_08605 [Jatrophihabitans sp.]